MKLLKPNIRDLWKLYHLGLVELDNLTIEDQREIENYNMSMEEYISDEELESILEPLDVASAIDNENIIKNLAKKYKMDYYQMKARLLMYEKEKQKKYYRE